MVAAAATVATDVPALSASNEELSYIDPVLGCRRWPPKLFLLASDGQFVRGRCGSANLCEYCLLQELALIRRSLSLDALETGPPEVVAVFGTRTPTLDPAPFYKGRELVMRALRREFPEARYSCLSEFTTGKGTHSGGLRRPHWNMLLKGIPAAAAGAARSIALPIWCRHVDAEERAQYVEPLESPAAFMRYVAQHFTKTSQQPPRDSRWKHKQRFNCSRDYFAPLTRAEARERAWWSLQLEREVVKATKAGADDPMAIAAAAIERLKSVSWSLYDAADQLAPERELVQLVKRTRQHMARWEALSAA